MGMWLYFQLRRKYLSECAGHGKRNWVVAMLILAYPLSSFVSAVQTFIDIPLYLRLPKLPLPWAVAIIFAGIAYVAIEGGYRLMGSAQEFGREGD